MPIGSRFHREFRDLDTRRLPAAPPRPGAPTKPTEVSDMNKTEVLLNYLMPRDHQRMAQTAREISEGVEQDMGENIDPNTVSALLRTVLKGPSRPQLQSIKQDGIVRWWWDAELEHAPPVEPANQEPAGDPPPPPAVAKVATVATMDTPDSDPILASIAHQAEALQRPGIPNAELHAKRLRAIAEMPVFDATVAAWMVELAGYVEATGVNQ